MWTVEEIRQYAKKMVERETRGNGDQLNALIRVGSWCGMHHRSLQRLISGEHKDVKIRHAGSILSAYQAHLASLISQYQSELEAVQARLQAMHIGPVDEEIEALSEKLRLATKKAKQGR